MIRSLRSLRVCRAATSTPAPATPRTLDTLTPEELEELRREALRGGKPKCPADGGILKLIPTTHLQSRGDEFIARCPICYKQARLRPPVTVEIDSVDASGARTRRTETI